ALLRHVLAHHRITALGHPRNVLAPRRRMKPKAERTQTELARHRAHLLQMLVYLVAGLMQRLERGARELELTPRLERDGAPLAVRKPDEIAGIAHRRPAEALQALEERADAVAAVIRCRLVVAQPKDEFFVLGADAPLRGGLAAGGKMLDELALLRDRHAAGMRWSGHQRTPPFPF